MNKHGVICHLTLLQPRCTDILENKNYQRLTLLKISSSEMNLQLYVGTYLFIPMFIFMMMKVCNRQTEPNRKVER